MNNKLRKQPSYWKERRKSDIVHLHLESYKMNKLGNTLKLAHQEIPCHAPGYVEHLNKAFKSLVQNQRESVDSYEERF